MIVEKISMVDALNMETKELMDSYQQLLENMSKEELISEIGNLLVDKGLLLTSRDGYINELKEDNNRLNGLLADGTEVMDYWQDKYLEEKSKNDELQKQVDELTVKVKSFEMTDLCKDAYIEQLKEENKELVSAKVFELETKNTKLQKQVEELKKWLSMKEHYIGLIENRLKQSVKDTAKEIFAELFYIASIHHSDVANILAWAKEKAKSKGVEVE